MANGTIAVSLRSKGLPSFNKSLNFDFRYQAVQFATEFLDVFLAFFVSFSCLSWTAWISIAVAIASVAGTMTTSFASATLDLVFMFFMYIVLPLLVLLVLVFSRRDQALRSLSELKASFVSLMLHRPLGVTPQQRNASEELYRKAAMFIEDLRQYLQHRRPYARHFYLPYRASSPSPTDQLVKVSRELGRLLRKVHHDVRDLHLACSRLRDAGISEAQFDSLVKKVEALHAVMERLMSIKEMRTPVVLRATIRWFVVVLIPIALGPFWNNVAIVGNLGAFAGILGVLTQVALVGILDTVVAMEDPFDDTALDAISLFEMLDQVGAMTTSRNDFDGYDTEGLGAGGDPGGGGSPPNPHVTMFMGAGDGTFTVPADMSTMAGLSMQASMAASAAGPGPGNGTAPGTMEHNNPGAHTSKAPNGLAQPAGVPAMRASVANSETAVGPPSTVDAYGGAGGACNLPSITSTPLPDVMPTIRGHNPMPPMPALAGHPMYRTGLH